MHKLTVYTLTTLLLTGCANFRHQIPLVLNDPLVATDCGDLLGYYENYSDMSSERRKQELIATTQKWSLAPMACKQLRQALILSQPGNTEKSRKKALKLLANLLDEKNNTPIQARQLAELLKDQLKLQQSLHISIHKLRNNLKNEQMTSQLQLKQLSGLQSQLRQLKSIEESINEKEQAIITPASNNTTHESAQNITGR